MADKASSTLEEDEIDLLNLLLIFVRRWRMISTITAFAACTGAAIAILIPNTYQANAKVIALKRETITPVGAVTSLAEDRVFLGAQRQQFVFTSLPVLQDILQSNSVVEALVRQYNVSSRKELLKHYKVVVSKNGMIEILYEDTDPKRAAAIANAAVVELGRAAYAVNLIFYPEITAEHDLEKLGPNVTTSIKLLQTATPPDHKNKPKRSLIVILCTITALACSVLLAFILERLHHLQQNDCRRWNEIKAALRE